MVQKTKGSNESNSSALIKCSMCGLVYDPLENPACGTCPLHQGCTMTCCPRCGTSNINIHQSWVVGIAKKLFSGGDRVSS